MNTRLLIKCTTCKVEYYIDINNAYHSTMFCPDCLKASIHDERDKHSVTYLSLGVAAGGCSVRKVTTIKEEIYE